MGLVRWTFTLHPGACRRLSEAEFVAETHSAVHALLADHGEKVREVQARLAAPGWDGIATAEEGGVFVIGDGVLEMVDVAAHAAEEGHGEEHTIAGIDVNSTLLCTDELLKHTVRLLDQREQQIADILTGDDHILADPANKKCFTAPEPSVVGLSHEPVKQYWNQFD